VYCVFDRVWEKIEEKMKDAGRGNTGLKKAISDWAKAVGSEHSNGQQFGASMRSPWTYPIAEKLVFSNVNTPKVAG
jgi:long-subunit acyl-CoA synthetase (AMP-forming)